MDAPSPLEVRRRAMNKRIVGLWMRFGVAALSTLLAVQATTGKAWADVQDVTVTSITRTSLTTIQVSGTATFDPAYDAIVGGSLAQSGRPGWVANDGPFIVGHDFHVTTTFEWSLTFFNPYGWKAGPATLTVSTSRDHYVFLTKSLRVILPNR
jgi:hypothetical protein